MAAPYRNMKPCPMTQVKLYSVFDICKKCVRFKHHKHVAKQKKNKDSFHPTQESESPPTSLVELVGFNSILSQRRAEAYRSVFVRSMHVQGTMADLIKHGKFNTAFVTNHGGFNPGVLAEYSTDRGVEQLKGKTSFFSEGGFPAQTRLLFHQPRNQRSHNKFVPPAREDMLRPLESVEYTPMSSVDEELKLLCEKKSLNDIDLRKRFLLCIILEEMLQSVMPGSRVIPFGSCLNGFGWWTSDLDMMVCPPCREDNDHRTHERDAFMYLTKKFDTERELAQKTLAMVSSLVELIPQTRSIHNIFRAKVPIVKFKQRTLELDCDISFEEKDSLHMAQLLYLMSATDPRVRPLFTGIKEWAIVKKIISGGVENKTTTLGLIHLLVFYLQTVEPPVLPTLRAMQEINDSDVQIDSLNFTLPRSPASMPTSHNKQSIESLLHGFFLLFSTFEFKSNAISIIEGATFRKPANSSPLHVQNPMSMTLNICQNVAQGPLDHIQKLMGETADRMKNLSKLHQDIQRNQVSNLDILFNSRDMFYDSKDTDNELSEENIQKLFREDIS